jgi:putative PEP-CTERM system TPR-repeat lipoprotein
MSECSRTSRRRSSVLVYALALLAGVVSLSACDRFTSAEDRVARAQAAFAAGDYAKASTDAKTVLEKTPDNTQARELLARIAFHQGDFATARKELDRALESGANPGTLRDLHYDILLTEGRFEQALTDARGDSTFDEAPRQVVIATAQIALGQLEGARESMARALELAPNDPDVLLTQARLLWASGDTEASLARLVELQKTHPQSARAALFRGRFALSLGKAAEAAEAFATARSNARQLTISDHFMALAGLVESKLAQGDTAGAEADLQAVQQLAPNATPTRYLKARLAVAKRDFPTAVTELQRVLSADPDNAAASLLLGAALAEQGSLEQAGATLTRLVANEPENVDARKLLARVLLQRGDLAGARKVLDEAPAGATEDSAFDWLGGSALMMSGETESGLAQLERAASKPGADDRLKLNLAAAYLMAGRQANALAVLQALPPGVGGQRRQQLTLLAHVAGKPAAEAKKAIAELVSAKQTDPSLLVIAANYLLAGGSTAEAHSLLQRAVAADVRNTDAKLGLAVVAHRLGDPKAAGDQLRRVIELDPTNQRAYFGLAQLAAAGGNRDEARQWLERSIGADPSAVESRLVLAQLAIATGDAARADSLMSQALEVSGNRPATLHAVGQILLRASRLEDALRRFNEAAGLGSREADVSAATTLAALGREEEARGRLEAAARQQPQWLDPVRVLVGLDARAKRIDAALARLAAFEKTAGTSAASEELRAHVLTAAERHAEAAQSLERAARVRPNGPLAVKEFLARKAAGEKAPQASLVRWLEKNPGDPGVRMALASHYEGAGDRKAAIGEYERIVADRPVPVALNNLAWHYYETGDQRALEVARRAHQLAPQNADITDTLGWILVERGQHEEGLKLLEGAAKGGAPEIRYHYAAALARANQREQAVQVLRNLLSETPEFASRKPAQALRDSLT